MASKACFRIETSAAREAPPFVSANLAKWGLNDTLLVLHATYSHRKYHPLARAEMLRDVFCDHGVAAAVNRHWASRGTADGSRLPDAPSVSSETDEETGLLPISSGRLRDVVHARVPATLTSTHAFDALSRVHIMPDCYEVDEEYAYTSPEDGGQPIVREGTGIISKTFDVSVGGFLVSDLLRVFAIKNLEFMNGAGDGATGGTHGSSKGDFCGDDEGLQLSHGERREFLFRLFCHLAIGGAINQFEDTLAPYIDTASALYKSLMRVQRRPQDAQTEASSMVGERARVAACGDAEEAQEAREAAMVEVVSDVYKVTAFKVVSTDADGAERTSVVRVGDSVQDFCYVIVDDFRGRVSIVMNKNRSTF